MCNRANVLTEHNAKYHKICRTKFNTQKIERLSRKTILSDNQNEEQIPLTRSHLAKADARQTCMFCEKEEGDPADQKLVLQSTLGIGPTNHYTITKKNA